MKKELQNSVKLAFISKSENEALARHVISAFIAQADPTAEELADIRTVVSEAVTNCVVHAYREKIGTVYFEAKLYSDRSLSIIIKDKGCGIEDIEKAMEPLYTTDKDGERGGMGFTIMQSFTDSLKVKSKVGKGTSLYMKKQFT